MPSEVGVGYQGPPEQRDAYGPEVERQRSLEDYVSRRIFANLGRTSDQFIPLLAYTAISWHTAGSTDSSGLFPTSGSAITIPQGARGDYLFSLHLTWRDKYNPAAATLWITKNGVTQAMREADTSFMTIFTDMSLVEGDIVVANVVTNVPAASGHTGYNISWEGLPAGGGSNVARPPTSFHIRRLL